MPRQSRDDDKKPPGRNYITPAGFRKLQVEFEELRFKTRRECVQKLSEAAAEGDRSENAEYIYRKKQLREIDRRIRFLVRRMALAEVIDPRQHSGDKVRFGVVVTLEDEVGKRVRYQIVGEDESEPREGKISWSSPLGRALVGKEVGDVATLRVAAGDRELSIEAIELPGQEGGTSRDDVSAIAAAKAAAEAALAEQGRAPADSDDDDDYDTEDEPRAQRG